MDELDTVREVERGASGIEWREGETGTGTIRIVFQDGRSALLRVTRNTLPASPGDIAFIAHARDDVAALLEALELDESPSTARVVAIEQRLRSASPGPWRAFVQEAGGIGGESVIWVSEDDSEPDMYLYLDGHPAPAADYQFVAMARNVMDRLLAAVKAP